MYKCEWYKCECCGGIFDEPFIRRYKESREFWGMTCYEEFIEETCPYCDSDDFREYDEEEDEEEDELC